MMSQPRLDLLREALPYIQRFKGKTFVVKLSGKVTEDAENLASLAEELALLHQVGIRVCVVHGGGKQLSALAEQMGVAQTIIEGRRVTDDATLDMAKMVFAGKINTDILAALRRRGIEAVGLSGGDAVEVNDRLPRVLLDNGYLPVISSLGADAEGSVFNINADTVAAELAVRLEAEKLIMLSDVDGIYLRPGEQATKLSRLTAAEVGALVADGVATGGMIPKLQNITDILRRGVRSAHIIKGSLRNALFAEVFTDEGTGTMIVA